MTRPAQPSRLARFRGFVLWLLVAAVPWQVATASTTTLAMSMAMASTPAAPPAADPASPPCHGMPEEHADAAAPGGGTCSACAACCVMAAPPMPVAAFEPSCAPCDRTTLVVQPEATFLTDGPLRPPRSPRR